MQICPGRDHYQSTTKSLIRIIKKELHCLNSLSEMHLKAPSMIETTHVYVFDFPVTMTSFFFFCHCARSAQSREAPAAGQGKKISTNKSTHTNSNINTNINTKTKTRTHIHRRIHHMQRKSWSAGIQDVHQQKFLQTKMTKSQYMTRKGGACLITRESTSQATSHLQETFHARPT